MIFDSRHTKHKKSAKHRQNDQMRKELLTDHPKIHDIHPIFARNIAVPFEVMRMPVEP